MVPHDACQALDAVGDKPHVRLHVAQVESRSACTVSSLFGAGMYRLVRAAAANMQRFEGVHQACGHSTARGKQRPR